MKPFDLEAAKRGEPIQSRDGTPVKFIAHVQDAASSCRLVLMQHGMVFCCDEGGAAIGRSLDLFMAPKKRTVWLNLYDIHPSHGSGYFYPSQEEADEGASPKRIGDRAWSLVIEE